MFTVLDERMGRDPSGHTRREWLCRCVCGDTKWRSAGHVKDGRSTQCKACANTTHGHSKTREYKAWYAMIHRCTNPTNKWYHRYGARGITVADTWMEFEQFLADMGLCPEGMTIERKNNDEGYSKENCVWATRAEQMRNYSHNVHITAFGKTQHLAEWAREHAIRHDTLSWRLRNGWPVEKALTTPTRTPKCVSL